SLIGTCRMNGVEPYAYLVGLFTKLAADAYLVGLFTKLAAGHLNKDIDALMPWAYADEQSKDVSSPGTP
ncbi:transposase domain-containing protein, partial [Leisingera sp. JC1]|uniref:transposase domain-containing protein n=1 Tax=Leisingera sp. JC1 TaxID=1855282 RepID=UPI000803937A